MAFTKTLLLALGYAAGSAVAYAGDATWYDPGLGACGGNNNGGERVVALSPGRYSGSCGKNINVHYGGKTASAKVVDLCPGCAGDSVDLSPAAFQDLASLDKGRIQVTWEFA